MYLKTTQSDYVNQAIKLVLALSAEPEMSKPLPNFAYGDNLRTHIERIGYNIEMYDMLNVDENVLAAAYLMHLGRIHALRFDGDCKNYVQYSYEMFDLSVTPLTKELIRMQNYPLNRFMLREVIQHDIRIAAGLARTTVKHFMACLRGLYVIESKSHPSSEAQLREDLWKEFEFKFASKSIHEYVAG